MTIRGKLLFKVTPTIYNSFIQQVPAEIFENFEGEFWLKIVPRLDDVSMTSGLDQFGNAVLSDYSRRIDGTFSYTLDLNYDLYAYYKILQAIQNTAVSGTDPLQVEMADFINPALSDQIPTGLPIPGFTKRYGVITELQLLGGTYSFLTQVFDTPSNEYLKTYRTIGTRFTFEERGVPSALVISAPGGSLTLYPLISEIEEKEEGGEDRKFGYSDTFVRSEVRKRVYSVNMNTTNIDDVNTLKTLQASCIDTEGNYNAATLSYGGNVVSGILQSVQPKGGVYNRLNKTTLVNETTNSGLSFTFKEL